MNQKMNVRFLDFWVFLLGRESMVPSKNKSKASTPRKKKKNLRHLHIATGAALINVGLLAFDMVVTGLSRHNVSWTKPASTDYPS
jgi:hypothetical protein